MFWNKSVCGRKKALFIEQKKSVFTKRYALTARGKLIENEKRLKVGLLISTFVVLACHLVINAYIILLLFSFGMSLEVAIGKFSSNLHRILFFRPRSYASYAASREKVYHLAKYARCMFLLVLNSHLNILCIGSHSSVRFETFQIK